MALYKQAAKEIDSLEQQIMSLIEEINPKTGIGKISHCYLSKYGDLSKFSLPSQMLSFAGLEPGYY
ncbi:MAG: transposase [Clostridiaceae bacterium]|jgi:hypothetical protein|nr:transposase [Clostridiaceae bacterium]